MNKSVATESMTIEYMIEEIESLGFHEIIPGRYAKEITPFRGINMLLVSPFEKTTVITGFKDKLEFDIVDSKHMDHSPILVDHIMLVHREYDELIKLRYNLIVKSIVDSFFEIIKPGYNKDGSPLDFSNGEFQIVFEDYTHEENETVYKIFGLLEKSGERFPRLSSLHGFYYK